MLSSAPHRRRLMPLPPPPHSWKPPATSALVRRRRKPPLSPNPVERRVLPLPSSPLPPLERLPPAADAAPHGAAAGGEERGGEGRGGGATYRGEAGAQLLPHLRLPPRVRLRLRSSTLSQSTFFFSFSFFFWLDFFSFFWDASVSSFVFFFLLRHHESREERRGEHARAAATSHDPDPTRHERRSCVSCVRRLCSFRSSAQKAGPGLAGSIRPVRPGEQGDSVCFGAQLGNLILFMQGEIIRTYENLSYPASLF